ncbi:MAG TPA: hypothetical protein VNO21_19740, partial [Polyangiaceae bacterium]|nr:hypothetical protein [Polyangiaceae bacterium]
MTFSSRGSLAVCTFLGAVLTLVSRTAGATPKYNPFTYSYDTLGEGEIELEQYADVIPLKALNAGSGTPQWYGATQFQTEFEYGITDRLELGLYITYAPRASEALVNTATTIEGTGSKQRLRLRLVDEGVWPVDVALYGEIVENDREIEL